MRAQKQLYAEPESGSTPLYSYITLRTYDVMNGLGGGAQTDFVPGRGKPRYATVLNLNKVPRIIWKTFAYHLSGRRAVVLDQLF